MFYKVAMNTELQNIKSLLLGEIQLGSCEPPVTKFSSTNQYVTLFFCVFLFKTPYLMYLIDSLTLSSQCLAHCQTVLQFMFEWSLSNRSVFSLSLGTLDSISALWLRATLNSKITNKKHKSAIHVGLNRLQRGHFLIVWKLGQESRDRDHK